MKPRLWINPYEIAVRNNAVKTHPPSLHNMSKETYLILSIETQTIDLGN